MSGRDIIEYVDHTLLAQGATWEEIKCICDDGIKYNTASVCIPPSFVKQAKEYVKDKMAICTVIGFPNGYNTTAVKVFETADAVENGADEIDMVINIGWVKAGLYDNILEEIRQIKKSCSGRLLKVIIETCLLDEAEIIKLCKVVSESGAEYIKTSTGFSTSGATKEAVEIMCREVEGIKVKAAGGIATIDDAKEFIALGASRLGTSRIVKILKENENAD